MTNLSRLFRMGVSGWSKMYFDTFDTGIIITIEVLHEIRFEEHRYEV